MKKVIDFLVSHSDWITVVGGLIALLGSILVNVKSKRDSVANEHKQTELLKQSIEINQMMTGGDSYPLITFFDIEDDFGVGQYAISNQGKFPLYVTQFTISDNFEINKIMLDPNSMTPKGINGALLEPYTKTIMLEEIMPKTSLKLNTFPFQFKEGGSFTMSIIARNGTFSHQTLTCKVAGRWLLAHRLTKFGNTNPIHEYIPPNFPRNLISW